MIYQHIINISIPFIHGEFTLSTKIYHRTNNTSLAKQDFSVNKGETTPCEKVLQCPMMVHVATKLMG